MSWVDEGPRSLSPDGGGPEQMLNARIESGLPPCRSFRQRRSNVTLSVTVLLMHAGPELNAPQAKGGYPAKPRDRLACDNYCIQRYSR